MDGEQVCRYLGISGRTLQRLRTDHVITYSAINRKLYYSLTEIRRVLKERSVRRKNLSLIHIFLRLRKRPSRSSNRATMSTSARWHRLPSA